MPNCWAYPPTPAPTAGKGAFVSPGLWVDRWEVQASGAGGGQPFTFIFTTRSPRSRPTVRGTSGGSAANFAQGEQASKILLPIFTDYYRRVQTILETMQAVLDGEGPRREVHVSADAAALQVRKIIRNMVADEAGRPMAR